MTTRQHLIIETLVSRLQAHVAAGARRRRRVRSRGLPAAAARRHQTA